MKLLGVSTTYYVEYDGEECRTSDGKGWEVAMGESWEPAYWMEDELTAAFSALPGAPRPGESARQILENRTELEYRRAYEGDWAPTESAEQ